MNTPHDDRLTLTPLQRRTIIGVAAGAVALAAIGFLGSYSAVAALAKAKGFGAFSALFPIGIDAGIGVLLALDLLLTWVRIPFPLLRQTAWLLTIATIAFNAAAASDRLGMGMHAVIPVLFIVVVEAARHAIGRTADITADKHMEGVRLIRWLLAPFGTFRLWRRMRLWELRSYDAVIRLEQERLVERARLRARYGRRWRSKAPVEAVMALRLTRYGRALAPVSGVLDIEHAPVSAVRTAIESGTFQTAANEAITVASGHAPDTETDTAPDASGQPDSSPDNASGQTEPPLVVPVSTSADTHPDTPDPLSALAEAASGPSDLVRALAAHGIPRDLLVSEAVRLRPDLVADSIRRTVKRLGEGPYL